MRILVIGGTGLSGTPLVEELAAAGHELIVASRGERPVALPPGAVHVALDAHLDHASLVRLEPEVVVDMIAVREEHAERVAAFAGVARRAVVASSCDVYLAFGRLWRTEPGDPVPLPLREDAPLRTSIEPRGAAYNKVALERRLASAGLPVTVLRLPAVHGPRDRQGRLWPYLRRLADGRPFVLSESLAAWRWSRGYSVNVAHALALAALDERAAGRTYNVGEPALCERDWAVAVADAAGATAEIITVPDAAIPHWAGFDLRQHLVTDTSAIRAELGYAEPVALADGLRATVAWEREHPAEHDWLGDYAEEDAALAAAPR